MTAAPLWSILIPTIPGREDKLARLLSSLEQQADRAGDVEVLVLRDNRAMSIADKRNALVAIARGEYVSFVDDDDYVAPDYVASIREALVAKHADLVLFRAWVRVRAGAHGVAGVAVFTAGPCEERNNADGGHVRAANHLMVWRTSLARRARFEGEWGEDTRWAEEIRALLPGPLSVVESADILYIYDADYRGRE